MFVKDALQSIQQGILICNSQGRIIFFNEAYGAFIGCSLEEAKGKSVTDFRKNAMVPEVIKSQIAIEGMIRQEGNQEYFASIYPIIESGEFQGTISVVTTLASHQLKNSLKTQTLQERVRQFEREEILAEISCCGTGLEAKKEAARRLGISLSSLYNKIKE